MAPVLGKPKPLAQPTKHKYKSKFIFKLWGPGTAIKRRFEGFGHPGGPKSLNLSFLAPPRGPKSLNLRFLAFQNPKKLKYKFIFRLSGPPGGTESVDLKVLAPQGAPKA